ncbi:phosphocholine cytidylyltransferase family protein [Plantactinospora sp. KLBMP9567]|uniref:phosphocholine cytidylyltransferase family protein n=1 Tax=Plantactinospora sp. KLBMP9567 TaxID=3085900 RepID=UPI00298252E9|nr:phosphocholine cytidylyltransferase family protein [Plantactinospora sp. KLBMP9567]MDW5326753.1 phosphocholine cytidylyltransferase family protein [Plantactinospora sp. KLBMP9567]
MRGIILAAGRGSRLGGLTDDRPKCLTPLGGRPLLHRQVEALRRAGIDRLLVVGGYHVEQLHDERWTTVTAPYWYRTNMVRSLQTAHSWLRAEDCVVSYGDIVYSSATVRELVRSAAPLAISYDPNWLRLWRRRFDDPLADAENFRRSPGQLLLQIGGHLTTTGEAHGQYMGLLRIGPAGWAEIERLLGSLPAAQADRLDMTTMLQLLVEQGLPIRTVPCVGDWVEVDSASDLALYEQMLRAGELALEQPNSSIGREADFHV